MYSKREAASYKCDLCMANGTEFWKWRTILFDFFHVFKKWKHGGPIIKVWD
jgi:hypothetical protein